MLLKLVADFVESAVHPKGYGYFEGNYEAINLAKSLSEQQKKKFKRYGTIPSAFFIWMREAGIVLSTMPIPKGGTTAEELMKILERNFIGDEQLQSKREFEERERIQQKCDLRGKNFGLQDHVWIYGEATRIYKHLKPCH